MSGPLSKDGMHSFATYDASNQTVKVLQFSAVAALSRSDDIFANIPAPELYSSLIAHEVAHAIVFDNLGGRDLPRVAHEYLAYAVQFSTLTDDVRARLISSFNGSAWDRLENFSELMMRMAPNHFGFQAYLHFQHSGNGCRTVREILSGHVRFPTLEWTNR